MVPQTPFAKWTETAPTGSSIFAMLSKNSTLSTTRIAGDEADDERAEGETVSQPAVMATRPAREPLSVMETSGLP